MDHTDDIVNWPLLRQAGDELLRSVQRFYVFHRGRSALMFTGDHSVWAIGDNHRGLLGLGEQSSVTKPTQMIELRGMEILQLTHGVGHMMVLTGHGDLYGWGWNGAGQVISVAGKKLEDQLRPVLVMQSVKLVACGAYHTAVIRQDGTVWCWGRLLAKSEPVMIEGAIYRQGVLLIECGTNHCLALTAHRRLYHWGKFNETIRYLKPIEINLPAGLTVATVASGVEDFLVLDIKGQAFHCFYDRVLKFHCEPVELDEPVQVVASVYYQSCFCLKLKSGVVTVWSKESASPSQLTSCADACAVYCVRAVTPVLTTLPPHAIEPELLCKIQHFHQLKDADFKLYFGWKPIYLNREYASSKSEYIAEQFRGPWNNKEAVYIGENLFPVWLIFLRFTLTGTLGIPIEVRYARQILELALFSKNEELSVHCLEILAPLGYPLDKLLTDYANQWPLVLSYFINTLTLENCCYYYQLTVEADRNLKIKETSSNNLLREQIERLVSKHDLATLCNTASYKLVSKEMINLLLERACNLEF